MSAVLCRMRVDFGWRAVFQTGTLFDENVVTTAHDINEVGLVVAPRGPGLTAAPLAFNGDRLDQRPGYIGLAQPGESTEDAAARLTR